MTPLFLGESKTSVMVAHRDLLENEVTVIKTHSYTLTPTQSSSPK